jgi:hypothetical protein
MTENLVRTIVKSCYKSLSIDESLYVRLDTNKQALELIIYYAYYDHVFISRFEVELHQDVNSAHQTCKEAFITFDQMVNKVLTTLKDHPNT